MKLLLQPDDAATPVIRAISRAKSNIDIAIFRFDQREIERALTAAAARGVAVRALIAHTNRSGEESLRRLEMRLLGAGVTVARTGDDFPRYHGKLMVIDRRELYLMAFNLTYQDMEHSRSFGIVTRSTPLVREALKLLEADTARQPYEPCVERFLVSPINARPQLARFIKGAKKELLIYDPKISDPAMIRLLEDRQKAGVAIKILGRIAGARRTVLAPRDLAQMRLHTRSIIRDGRLAFIGSQSLRELELDSRREVGLIFRESKAVNRLAQIFHADWALTHEPAGQLQTLPTAKLAKKVAKAIARDLPPLEPLLNGAVKKLAGGKSDFDVKRVEETVKDAVKDAVKQAVRDVVEEAAAPDRAK